MLANTENAIDKLSEAAFFPTSFSVSNNDFTISRSLKDRCISRDYYLYSYFSQQGRSQLNTGGVEMMALYDMDGHGVAVQNGSYSEPGMFCIGGCKVVQQPEGGWQWHTGGDWLV